MSAFRDREGRQTARFMLDAGMCGSAVHGCVHEQEVRHA